jgi:hypothetical protein
MILYLFFTVCSSVKVGYLNHTPVIKFDPKF